jgi:hypothetical protein
MKITICGSIAFYQEMMTIKKDLELLGHEVDLPHTEIKDENGEMISVAEYYQRRKAETNDDSWIWDRKEEAIRMHFEKIAWAEAILVLNYSKNNIDNYIGGNTFLEMGVALHLNKKIYLLNNIPEISYKEEILGMKPMVIKGDLKKII